MEAVNTTKKHLRGAPPISVSLAPRSYTQCNTGNQFGVQRKSKPAENPHGLKLRCGYGAERAKRVRSVMRAKSIKMASGT